MDVLRENIGLLQFPYEDEYLNEGFLGFGKKKSRWQRFKDMVKRNKGKIGAGLLGAGALGGLIGKDYITYRREIKDLENHIKGKGFAKTKKGEYFYHNLSLTEPVTKTVIYTPKFEIRNPFKSNSGYINKSEYYTYNGKRFDNYDEPHRMAEKEGFYVRPGFSIQI